ncbi:helix-turn-helix domain-containing protein [Streptosporangium saharense]|uniref:helix-turn-helix domain-containing protein n=1 Tax=Streptosporangium saharense TaxID=1706840 RepID=UPI003696E1D0
MQTGPEQHDGEQLNLAQTLRRLRDATRLTGETVAARSGMSQAKLSKIETGRVHPSTLDVERILTALGTPRDIAHEVIALARVANTEYQALRTALRKGLEKKQRELAALEASASELRYFLPVMITGLLNTPEYAAATMSRVPGDHSRMLARKLERQSVLYDTGKTFFFLLSEAALRWSLVPPAAMAVQIDRITSVSKLPNVHVEIIPFSTHVGGGPLNTFTVYDDRLATAEVFGGAMVMRDPKDVTYHLELFHFFRAYALRDDAARAFLDTMAQEYRGR